MEGCKYYESGTGFCFAQVDLKTKETPSLALPTRVTPPGLSEIPTNATVKALTCSAVVTFTDCTVCTLYQKRTAQDDLRDSNP
jgi:hypothetical protein